MGAGQIERQSKRGNNGGQGERERRMEKRKDKQTDQIEGRRFRNRDGENVNFVSA